MSLYDLRATLTKLTYKGLIRPLIGFGFAELGSFTAYKCPGNPGVNRRLFRLPKSKSILVWYGLNNQGSEAISQRLKNQSFDIPIGISIAKTNNNTDFNLSDSINDYHKSVLQFDEIGDYNTINISCRLLFGIFSLLIILKVIIILI